MTEILIGNPFSGDIRQGVYNFFLEVIKALKHFYPAQALVLKPQFKLCEEANLGEGLHNPIRLTVQENKRLLVTVYVEDLMEGFLTTDRLTFTLILASSLVKQDPNLTLQYLQDRSGEELGHFVDAVSALQNLAFIIYKARSAAVQYYDTSTTCDDISMIFNIEDEDTQDDNAAE